MRAAYRRELVKSVRASALVLAVAFTLGDAGFLAGGRGIAAPALYFDLLVLIPAALAIVRFVPRRGRRLAEPLGLAVGLLAMVSVLVAGVTDPDAIGVVAGVAMIPLGFSLFIPLRQRPYVLWLGLTNALFFGGLALFGRDAAVWPLLPSVVVTAALSSALGVVSNSILNARRAQMDRQILAARGLYARMREHELDLRRQDDFLLMQQETLVVQQAELLRLNEELETIARLDALTGLGNRLRLNEDLAQLAGRIERSGGTAGLLLLDLDRFKRLNDSAGHLAGDAALRGVAEVLRRTSRVADGLYRYGGEEFLVVLHDCDESALELAGQRYIGAVEAAGMKHPDNAPWGVVTASAGASELSQRTGIDVDAALRAADEALYQAKGRGRNRLEVHAHQAPVVPIESRRAAAG